MPRRISWVVKLQRMQFGKSSEKLRQKTERQVCEAQERISVLQAEMLGEQHDTVMPQPLRQSSAHKPLPASLPRETRTLPPAETACPSCGGELSLSGNALSQSNWNSSAAPLKLLKRSGQNLPAVDVTTSFRLPCRQNPLSAATRALACWHVSSRRSSRNIRLATYRRQWA